MIFNENPLKACGPDRVLLAGSFACNGATNPVATSSRGRDFGHTFTVAYAATGIYTVTLPAGFKLPAQPGAIIVVPQWDAIANWFDVAQVAESTLNANSPSFVIQAHRSGVANAPAAAAGCRINFMIFGSNNTGS